jgi:hypothetical protein
MKQLLCNIFTFSVMLILSISARGQATQTSPATSSSSSWKVVEGFYQDTRNKNLFVQALAQDSVLLIKNLWQKGSDTLRPFSELVFIPHGRTDENTSQTIFEKDSTGNIKTLHFGGLIWNRVTRYTPVVLKQMPHTPAQLERFAGIYHAQSDSNNLFQFAVEGNELVLKGNRDEHLVPESALSFYKPDNIWFSVDFSKDAAGNITQALIVKRDVWIRNPKPAISEKQLHSYEGQYRAKIDSDNYIQLIARGKQLIIKQLWDGKMIELTQLADLYFYNKGQSVSLQFVRDGDGKIRQAWLYDTTEFDRKLPD